MIPIEQQFTLRRVLSGELLPEFIGLVVIIVFFFWCLLKVILVEDKDL